MHSFTGTAEDVANLCALDNIYIGAQNPPCLEMPFLAFDALGVNGCSLKTAENLQAMSAIPLDRMMIETDCPYCEIRNSHASKPYVRPEHLLKAVDKKKHDGVLPIKGRNEPCHVRCIRQDPLPFHKDIDVTGKCWMSWRPSR